VKPTWVSTKVFALGKHFTIPDRSDKTATALQLPQPNFIAMFLVMANSNLKKYWCKNFP